MDRVTRWAALVSIGCALAAHGWLASWQPALPLWIGVAFAAMFLLARAARDVAIGSICATAFIAPGLLQLAFATTDYHVLVVWLAAATGVVAAVTDPSRWHLPPRWAPPVIGWAVLLAASWPIVAMRETDFSVAIARSIDAPGGLFGAPPPVAAAFVVIFAIAQLLGLMWFDLLWMLGRDRAWLLRVVIAPFIGGAALSAAVGVYQWSVDLDFVNPSFWSNLQRAGGLMRDANSLGTGAAVWAPVAVIAAWAAAGRTRIAAGVCALALTVGMWASGSRTALLVFAAGALGVFIVWLRHRGLWRPGTGRLVAAVVVGVALAVLAFAPRDPASASPVQRAVNRLPRLDATELTRFVNELSFRFGYGQAARDMVREHPVAGVGAGAFHILVPEYIYRREGRALAPDNAQNWWRHQVAELGIVGAVPAIWWSLLVGWLLLRPGSGAPEEATVVRGVLWGVAAASLLGGPTHHPANWISVTTLVFGLASLGARTVVADAPRRPWATHLSLGCVAVALVALVHASVGTLRPPARAIATGVPYSAGLSGIDGVSDYGDAQRILNDAVWITPVLGRGLQLTLWPQSQDVAKNPIDIRILLEGAEVASHRFTSVQPVTFTVEMPSARMARLEFHPTRQRGRARLHLATRWMGRPRQ